jgi:DNA-binding NarL/FixJ family response regulator
MDFLKNIFKGKKSKTGLVYIAEDDEMFAKTLKHWLEQDPHIRQVKIFPVGELVLLELDKSPDLIIMDFFLNSKYRDAENGLEITREIHERNPDINIILLSAQDSLSVVIESIKKYHCSYVKKGAGAFEKIREVLKEVYS